MKVLSMLALLAAAVLAPAAARVLAQEVPVQPTDAGDSVRALLYARPFTLETPYPYTFVKERLPITSGYVLVVEVDPAYAQPRDVGPHVLYVGRYPAELTDFDTDTGRLVVIVPGDVDLARDPIFFGSPEIPERVDAARGRAEREAALGRGIRPPSPEALGRARAAGGEPLAVRDAKDLYSGLVADLIERYAPSERDRAASYRAPRVAR